MSEVEILTREGEESYFSEEDLLEWVETLPPEMAQEKKESEGEEIP